jgi:hypothetical protein
MTATFYISFSGDNGHIRDVNGLRVVMAREIGPFGSVEDAAAYWVKRHGRGSADLVPPYYSQPLVIERIAP